MKEKYDGWCIKSYWGRNPWLVVNWFGETRIKVIEGFEKATGDSWKKHRKAGNFKLVKVRLVEVEEG